jgi:hypothetical protein
MPDWTTTRLAVIVDGNTAEPVSPIESFTANLTLNTEVIHSLEATHLGYIANPDAFSWTANVRAIGPAAARLTRLGIEGKEFSIGLYETKDSTGQEWTFQEVLFSKCLITAASPSGTINGTPMATFSGIARQVDVKDGGGEPLTLPKFRRADP